MTAQSSVTITAGCDQCGHPDATWTGARTTTGGTAYSAIDCPRCVGWTVRAQAARRQPPAPRAPVIPLPTVVEQLFAGNPLWRLAQRFRRAA